MEQSPQSQLKLLILKGKEQGYLTFAEVNDHLPQDIIDSDQIEDIIRMINDMGIQVFESAPDADDLIMSDATADEDAVEEAAQALVSVDKELGRTTDPVRMYMREMGTVELLTREGEIDIAKRIEDGINQVQTSVAEYPEAITYLLEQWDKYEAEEIRLSDIVSAFVDPNEVDDAPVMGSNIGSDLPEEHQDDSSDSDDDSDEDGDSDSDDGDSGPDPELAKQKFAELRAQYEVTRNSIVQNGREHATTKTEIEKLSEVFRCFRLVPKQFDRLVKNMREMMDRVRVQERLVMKHAVEYAKMPKKNFVKAFTGHETSTAWVDAEISGSKPYSAKLAEAKDELFRCIEKLKKVEEETGLSIFKIKDINRRMSIGEAKARRAKKEMVEANLRLVISIAKKYTNRGLQFLDLIQEGNIGLMKAVKRFDPTVGVRLVSFAVHWIKAEIHEYVLKNWRIVKIATTKAQRKLFFNLRKAKKHLGWFNQQEVQQVAESLGVAEHEVREMESRMSNYDMPFDAPDEDDEQAYTAPVYYLEDKSSDLAAQVADDQWDTAAVDRLQAAIRTLDDRSQDIVRARWLDNHKLTLQELADRYQVSAERVRQLEKNAMKKLQQALQH